MPRTYYSPKRKLSVTVADDATDEQVRQELQTKADDHDADLLQAATARKNARDQMDPTMGGMLGPVSE